MIQILQFLTVEEVLEYYNYEDTADSDIDKQEINKLIKDASLRILADSNIGNLRKDWTENTITDNDKLNIQNAALILVNFYNENGLNPQVGSENIAVGNSNVSKATAQLQELPAEYFGFLIKTPYYKDTVFGSFEETYNDSVVINFAKIENDTIATTYRDGLGVVNYLLSNATVNNNKILNLNLLSAENHSNIAKNIAKLKYFDADGSLSNTFSKTAKIPASMKDVADNGGKWDYDAENNKIINLATPTNKTDATNKDYVDLLIAPLIKKTVLFGADGYILNTIYDPITYPQAPLTQKMFNDNKGQDKGLGSLDTNYQNHINLANQNTQLDNLEIGQRILYKDYSNKSLAAQHIIINDKVNKIPIPNLNTWVNEYNFTVAKDDKYFIKQLFYFKLLFTTPNKMFRISTGIHNLTTGVISAPYEQDFNYSDLDNDKDIKDQVFNWFKENVVDLETGYTYSFRMTIQGLKNTALESTEGTFSPAVYTSAPHIYDLTKRSYLELSELSEKGASGKLPVYKNQNFQNIVSRTTPARDDNYERTVKGWANNPISTKKMFDIQTNGGLVINEDYRQEIATSGKDRLIRADFTTDGFINSDGDYYAKFDVSGAFNFNNNRYLLYSNLETTTSGYLGRNIHQTGTTFFTIPHGISAGDLLFLLIKVLRTPTGEIANPYHLTFTEMGNEGIKGERGARGQQGAKGDPGTPGGGGARVELYNKAIDPTISLKRTIIGDTIDLKLYKNLQFYFIDNSNFGNYNIFIERLNDLIGYGTKNYIDFPFLQQNPTATYLNGRFDFDRTSKELRIFNPTNTTITGNIIITGELI